MTTPSRKGRRLVPTADNPELQELAAAQEALEQPQPPEGQFIEQRLLYPGARVESSVTLAVDFGDGKTSFFKYGATDIVQEHEDHPEIYARLATVTTDGVISLIDDAQDRLGQYEAELERRQRVIDRQTSGQQHTN